MSLLKFHVFFGIVIYTMTKLTYALNSMSLITLRKMFPTLCIIVSTEAPITRMHLVECMSDPF